jgi:hypothetical protein
MLRRRPYTLALVGWTFFVWTARIANVWRDEALDTGEKLGRTGLALSFTLLAVVAVVTLWRRAGRAALVAVAALAGWSVAVWVVRDVRILTGDHDAGFKVVHTVLAVVSIALAALAWREARQYDRQDQRLDDRHDQRQTDEQEAGGPITPGARR